MEKSFRIHTNITEDTLLNVNMQQDFDFLEILSLKLRQKDAYRLHSSNYGVVVGRVLANDAFGIPNAKVSVFIERDTSDSTEIGNIYPYGEVMSKDSKGRRYNVLPDYSDDTCYRVVGTFPRKRYLLDDNIQVEIYEKYWKYTTVTNQAGDYMLFGVPEGSQQIHVDIDLSDIGILSQKPSDFVFKGYNIEEFDSPSQFKESTNLDGLQQIISQNKTTVVYPFWGDANNGIAAITRCDVQVNYKFEPTCVFMGSIVSDNEGNSIGHKCAPDEDSGLNTQLVAGEGRIEMIRKTVDGLVEEFPIKGNALIDSDGVWCYQIPMNLDYIGTDEYGNIVPTDNPSKGIPTRTQVRFRMSKIETGDEGFSMHTAKYLVPMNPELDETQILPKTQAKSGQEIEKMYNFGSNTPLNCFRDLYWNNVYSVKNYIPKVQVAHRPYADNFGALKGGNLADNQNPLPFNKLRIDMPFMYMVVCIIYSIIIVVVGVINAIICGLDVVLGILNKIANIKIVFGIKPFKWMLGWVPDVIGCIPLSAGLSEGNVAYYPGCWCSNGLEEASCPEDMGERCRKERSGGELKDKVQQNLAKDYKIIKLDCYQDWINGVLYMPLWYWRKRKKKTFLFFTISGAKNEFCDCDKSYSRLKTYVTCNMVYEDNSLEFADNEGDEKEDRWHRKRRQWVRYVNGLIKGVVNKDGLTAYYYVGYQADSRDASSVPMLQRNRAFRVVKLYATDIILIGNLNENNLYGIPQLFKALPSTTSNFPPIASVEESLNADTYGDEGSDNEITTDGVDSGTTVTTGMDWGRNGDEDTPKYRKGLFIDLGCTAAGTAPKSCINVERLSELGVNPDMTFNMSYSNGSTNVKTGVIDADGFVNKYELDDLDNRATFATLNHIGFVPQDYQDSIGDKDTVTQTQVEDERTGYLVPKFKYIYPVDFDGRLSNIMKRYKGGFEQAMYDETDQAYLTFRLGAESSMDSKENLERRVRHFYHKNGKRVEMPLYNNSFYFYFGINKGNTAIDKFNKLFYSACFQRHSSPFTINTEYLGRSYCPETYTNNHGYNGYGYIRFTSDDVATPLKYTLYDSSSNIVVEEENVKVSDFVIGGYLEEVEDRIIVTPNPNGVVKYQNTGEVVDSVYGVSGLTNQTYTLEITDNNGRKLSERIELNVPKISVDFETEGLKTKFYSTGSTRMDYICNDETEFYGRIKLKSYTVDGYMYYITAATPLSYDTTNDTYKIRLEGINAEFQEGEDGEILQPIEGTQKYTTAIVRIGAVDSPNVGWVRDCMCDTGNTVFAVNGRGSHIASASTYQYWFSFNPYDNMNEDKRVDNQGEAVMYVYQPNRYTIAISQFCVDKELEDNTTSEIATVSNGNNFNAFLNDMPVKFMLGSITDSSAATIANGSYFYSSDIELTKNPLDTHISGWYGVHEEDSYMWHMSENQVLMRNRDMWSDYVQIKDDIKRHEIKSDILRFKFKTMFSLAKGAYVISDSTRFYYDTVGGISPILYRAVLPQYGKEEKMKSALYLVKDDNMVSCPGETPNIVGNNYTEYIGHEAQPFFNSLFGSNWDEINVVGNYFAAFTHNGGYTSKTDIDSSIHVMRIPNFTKVTPWKQGFEKRLGKDYENSIGQYHPAFSYYDPAKTQPYLRAMTVDRRLDYNLVLFGPCTSSAISLYGKITDPDDPTKKKTSPKENMWKGARISGMTYNGVEMSYDKDYNIISADTCFYWYVPDFDETNRKYSCDEYDDAVSFALTELRKKVPDAKWNDAISYVKLQGDGYATPNKRLEYSYNYSDNDEDAKTYYNSEENMIWEEDLYGVQSSVTVTQIDEQTGEEHVVYDANGNPKKELVYKDGWSCQDCGYSAETEFTTCPRCQSTEIETINIPVWEKEPGMEGQLLKRFYEASFVGRDIRNFFWSSFNKERLHEFSMGLNVEDSTSYVYKYPYEISSYNGDFNRRNVIYNKNYPTVRMIDVGNLVPRSSYDLIIDSCSYGIRPINEDEVITCEAEPEPNVSITTSFASPITFVPPNADSNDYANAVYSRNSSLDYNGYAGFKTQNVSIMFTMNMVSAEGFRVITALPSLIKVLPFPDGRKYDGISLLKTVTPNGEVDVAGSLDELLYNVGFVTLYRFGHRASNEGWISFIFGDEDIDVTIPDDSINFSHFRDGSWDLNGISLYGNYFLKIQNDEAQMLTSDNTEFQSIIYSLNNFNMNNVDIFTVLVNRYYMPEEGYTRLTNMFRTIEFGDLYDIRKILLKVALGEDFTYIEKVLLGTSDVTVTPEQQEGQDKPDDETGTSENYVCVQTLTFDMYIPTDVNPSDSVCEAFGDYTSMSYTFKFKNKNGDTYELKPSVSADTTNTDYARILFTLKWTQDMGVMGDYVWGGSTTCTIIAKTRSNFTYKLNQFGFSWSGQDGYDPDSKSITGDKPKISTNVSIL